jgi:hypothetical protein
MEAPPRAPREAAAQARGAPRPSQDRSGTAAARALDDRGTITYRNPVSLLVLPRLGKRIVSGRGCRDLGRICAPINEGIEICTMPGKRSSRI